MKRLILTAALALLALPAISQALVVGPPPQKKIYFWSSLANVVAGPKGQTNQFSSVRVIRPSLIYLTEDGAAVLVHLSWTGWGSSVAHATGISSVSDGIPSEAAGKRIKKPARLTLSSPGPFQGHEVYRCYTLTISADHYPPQYDCLQQQGDGVFYFGPAGGHAIV